jgi:methylated-DNA-[protein]-cysteine S-methyltransferase
MIGYLLFTAPIGPCGLIWGPRGVVGVQLPAGSEESTRRRLAGRFPGAVETPPPQEVERARLGILALLERKVDQLQTITLDLDGVPEFHRRVYQAARGIPPGATITYGALAAQLGDRQAARAVGQALGSNPFPIIVPCHRILGADGKLGGFSAPGGRDTKVRLLALEGALLL